jgi:thiosulfate dehydrogenase [quinone] large subunit
MSSVITKSGRIVEDPPLARFLFSDVRMAWLWTVVRVLIGISWLQAGLHKVGDPGWMQTGEALKGFWTGALAIPDGGKSKIAFDWYRQFLQGLMDSGSYVWFAKLVAVGEVLVGVALIVGAFVGIAAFFGALMNWNYVMAGTASTNALLLVGAIALILAWKIAGYYGADFFLLRYLGTPWQLGKAKTGEEIAAADKAASPGQA